MDRRPPEERRKIFTRKVMQKLYNYTDEKHASDNYAKNKASNDVDDGGNNDGDEIVPTVFPSNTNCTLKLTRSEHSSVYSSSTSGMDFNNPKTGQKKTVTSTLYSDKLSPYLTDDEDSEENGTRKKRKRRHRLRSTPSVSNNRSSSSSSASSKIQKSSTQTAALQLSRNQRRKLKRKKREKRIKIDANKNKSVAYSYTFKPKNQF